MEINSNLLPTRLQFGGGYAHGEYVVFAAPGVTVEQVVDPDFWLHVAYRLRVHDRIEIIASDGMFDMEVRVVSVDPRGHYAVVRPLRLWTADEKSSSPQIRQVGMTDSDGFIVEEDPVQGWRVLRGDTIIARRLKSQAEANSVRADAKAGKPFKAAS